MPDIRLGLPGWTIRAAHDEDLGSVLRLWEIAGTSPGVTDTREGLSRLLAVERGALLLAESGDELIGTLIAAWDGWRASFYRLAVHPQWRRRGIATALLLEGERHLRALGAVRLTAIVVEDDPTAIDFWHTVGYRRQPGRLRFIRPFDDPGTLA